MIIMWILGFVLRRFLLNAEYKTRLIPFQILAVILFVIEIIKQVNSYVGGYDLYCLPFHYCSLFISMLPMAAFYCGKHRKTVMALTGALTVSVYMLMLIYPALIYSAWDVEDYFSSFGAFHTVTFHNIVLMEAVLIITLDLSEPLPKRDVKALIRYMALFGLIAAVMSHLLKTNYANMYSCNIPPLESVRVSLHGVLGYTLTQILYVTIVALLQTLFTYGSYWLYVLLHRVINKGEK